MWKITFKGTLDNKTFEQDFETVAENPYAAVMKAMKEQFGDDERFTNSPFVDVWIADLYEGKVSVGVCGFVNGSIPLPWCHIWNMSRG